jgi:hypothetical protein
VRAADSGSLPAPSGDLGTGRLAAAAIEAFAYEDGDGNEVRLTLIFAVVLGFAIWRARAEPG